MWLNGRIHPVLQVCLSFVLAITLASNITAILQRFKAYKNIIWGISEGKSDIGKEQLMEQELFNPQSSSVSSSRIIYTPSTFARTSLLHLQEVGSLQAVCPHISQREDLVSFLCFIVLSGEGELSYEGQTYQLGQGACVFIDCRKAYSHSTSDNLWSLQWCHFYAPFLPAVYEKYKERGGRPVFHPDDLTPFTSLLTDFYNLASSFDYIRDMRCLLYTSDAADE